MPKKIQPPPKSFEDALSELERILREMDSGGVGLEDSLQKYERGNFLIQYCRGVLNSAEKQIEQLSQGPEGSLQASPMPQPEPENEP